MSRLWKRKFNGRLVALQTFSINCQTIIKGQIGAVIPKTVKLPPNDVPFWVDSASVIHTRVKFTGNCLVLDSDIGRDCVLTHAFVRGSEIKDATEIICSRITGAEIGESGKFVDCTFVMSKLSMYTSTDRGVIRSGVSASDTTINTIGDVHVGSGSVLKNCKFDRCSVNIGSRSTLKSVRCTKSDFSCEDNMHLDSIWNNQYSEEIVPVLELTKGNTVTMYQSTDYPVTAIHTGERVVAFNNNRIMNFDESTQESTIAKLLATHLENVVNPKMSV